MNEAGGGERVQEAAALRLLSHLPTPVAVLDGRLAVLSASEAFLRAFGLPRSAVEGRPFLDLHGGVLRDSEAGPWLERLLDDGQDIRGQEFRVELPDLGTKAFCLHVHCLAEPLDGPHFLLTLEDRTEQVAARELLAQEKERLQALLEQLPVGVIVAEGAGLSEVFHNEAAGRILRHPIPIGPEAWGKVPYGPLGPDGSILPRDQTPLMKVFPKEETLRELDVPYRLGDGTLATIRISAGPIRTREGRPAAVLTVQDVTEEKAMEAQLQEKEERLRLLLDAVQDFAIIGTDRSGVIVHWNRGAEALLGWTAGEALGRDVSLIYSAADLGQGLDEAERARTRSEGRAPHEHWHRRKDGTLMWASGSMMRVQDAQGAFTGYVKVFRDMTLQLATESALRKFKFLADHSSDAMYLADREGRFQYVNRTASERLGYAEEELLRMRIMEVNPAQTPDTWSKLFDRAHGGSVPPFEVVHLQKGGERIPQEISMTAVTFEGERLVLGVGRDLRERKRTEAALRQAQKLESMGIMAGGIAHDFNNLLSAIIGNVDLIEMELGEGSGVAEYLSSIQQLAERSAGLTRQMLAYSGRGSFEVKALDLNRAVEEITGLLGVSISKKAEIRFELATDLPKVQGDATQIHQVVMNLIINASEALGERGGEIVLRTGTQYLSELEAEEVHHGLSCREGLYVTLEVRDSGPGMDSPTLERIFDPFFSTKFAGRGLGLAAVQGIVRGHRGGIRVLSRPGRGTTFRILLPAMPAEAPPVRPPAPARHRGTVLVVDDEAPVRQVAKNVLARMGFDVVEARDGVEATELYLRHRDAVLVLLDLTMPRMDGEETLKALQRINPAVRAILSSGFTEREARDRFAGAGVAAFLPKPYHPAELMAFVEQVVQAPS